MRYFPYNFLASRAYEMMFCNCEKESDHWGVLQIDKKPKWLIIRVGEAEAIGRACMSSNTVKMISQRR